MTIQDNPLRKLAPTLSTDELRRAFLVEGLFRPGEANLHWWETDRTVMGAVIPESMPLMLPNPEELKSAHFLDRREAGIINLGGPGEVVADGAGFEMDTGDALYLGRGTRRVAFASHLHANPARFWIMSYPAHAAHPAVHVPFKNVQGQALGSPANANQRTLHKLIHPGTVATCQLVMGMTRIEAGGVWNSVPPHTHLRRSEVYLYFNVPPGQTVVHLMGEPSATRHLMVRDLEAVLSPPWSIHCGAGTASYSFVWCMGGENQEFSDMDPAPVADLR